MFVNFFLIQNEFLTKNKIIHKKKNLKFSKSLIDSSQLAAHIPAYCNLFLFRSRMAVRKTSMFPTVNSESAHNTFTLEHDNIIIIEFNKINDDYFKTQNPRVRP